MNGNVFDERVIFSTPIDDGISEITEESSVEVIDSRIQGRVVGCSTDSAYHRIFIRKIYDRFVFGQHMSDICNTLIVRCKNGDFFTDYHVYVYGKLAGGMSEVKVGSKATIYGKSDSKNRYLARKMQIDGVEISIQNEFWDFGVWLVLLCCLLLLCGGKSLINSLHIDKYFAIKELLFFLAGVSGTLKLQKKMCRYYVPFSKRIKRAFFVGVFLMIIAGFLL